MLEKLEVLDISDCDIGQENVLKIVEGLKKSKSLRVFWCNYNEADEAESQYQIFEALFYIPTLKQVEFRGNMVSKKLETAVRAKFEEVGKSIEFKDTMQEDEDDEEDEEEDEEASELSERIAGLSL